MLRKTCSILDISQRCFGHVFCSFTMKLQANPIFLQMELHGRFRFLPSCFCHSSFAPELLFPFLLIQQDSVIYYFVSCQLLIPLCRTDYSCWLREFFSSGNWENLYKKQVFSSLICWSFQCWGSSRTWLEIPGKVLTNKSGVHFINSLQLR